MTFNTTIKTCMLTVCMLTTATSSYAGWLDKLDSKEKLAIGTAAVGAIHSMATADERKAEEEKQEDNCDIIVDRIPSLTSKYRTMEEERDALCKKQAKQKQLDKRITGNFGLKLGDKIDQKLCIEELDIYVCMVGTNNNKYFNKAEVAYNPDTLEITRITGYKYIKSNHEKEICGKQAKILRAGLIKKGYKVEEITENFVDYAKSYIGRVNNIVQGYDKAIEMVCHKSKRDEKLVTVYVNYVAIKPSEEADIAINRALNDIEIQKSKAEEAKLLESVTDSF